MDINQAQTLAENLMSQHLRHDAGWHFEWMDQEHVLGDTSFKHMRIRMSRRYVEMEPEAGVRDTILHEIAHVLAGPGAGHSVIWKRIAAAIGAAPRAAGSSTQAEVERANRLDDARALASANPLLGADGVVAPGARMRVGKDEVFLVVRPKRTRAECFKESTGEWWSVPMDLLMPLEPAMAVA